MITNLLHYSNGHSAVLNRRVENKFLSFKSPVVSVRTTRYNIKKIFILPYSVYVFCIFPLTVLPMQNKTAGICNKHRLCFFRFFIPCIFYALQ